MYDIRREIVPAGRAPRVLARPGAEYNCEDMLRLPVPAIAGACCVMAAVEDGSALFVKNCAVCHNPGGANRTPTPDMLRKLSKAAIVAALETGVMKAQAASMSPAGRVAVAEYLGAGTAAAAAQAANACPENPPFTRIEGWNGWAGDLANSRFQPAAAGGLTAADVPKLKVKWAFGFPDTLSVFGQPTIAGGRLFFGSSSGTVYSLDTTSGCVYWTFKAPTTVRTPISLGKLPDGRIAAYFGDTRAAVYAIDAQGGQIIWKAQADDHKFARVTGAPKLVEGRLYVPVASGVEEMLAAQPKYPCCTFRGSVAAFDAATGKRLWKTYTIPDPPAIVRTNAAGTKLFGPSGAGVWSSPTVDLKRRALYVGTGNNYSDPATRYSDAVIAFDMDTGSVRWVRQMNPGDAWNGACLASNGNDSCPQPPGEDTDIGASPILATLDGRDVLAVGQKSGVVYGIDPGDKGGILWKTRIGKGGALGGIMWGMAAVDGAIYVPLSDFSLDPNTGGGMFALSLNGKVLWSTPAPRPACEGKNGCGTSQMAPATAIPGAVFSGSMDGHLRAYDAETGKVIWDFDTLREFDTVNGVKARGGSLNATGPTAAGGTLFVDSGYGQLGGMPGNVLLALTVEGK